MERIISVEEKIRRAEEIYQRRKQGESRPVAKVTVNNKKDIKLLKKMIIQILICVIIYLLVYMIQNNQYIFSQDFINETNKILSYDINFIEIYDNIKNQFMNLVNQGNNEDAEIMAIGGAIEQVGEVLKIEAQDENAQDEKVQEQTSNENQDNIDNQNLSQAEIDIQNVKNTTNFIKPIEGTITSKYGQIDVERSSNLKGHTGTDIATNLGTKIKSATNGEVVLVSEEGGYGKHIKVQIGEVSIIYAHCNNIYVKQGDQLAQGQEIAEVGTTGNSTGPHLHFEIRISERTVDPQAILEL